MMQRSRKAQRRKAIAAMEMAFVSPMIIFLLLGVWEIGRAVETQQILSNAAREGGRQASTALKTTAQVQQDVLNYLQFAGLNNTGATVTITNLTQASRSSPDTALNLDHLQVSVSIPVNNIKWVVTSHFLQSSTLTTTSDWYSMKNLPVTVSSVIPVQ